MALLEKLPCSIGGGSCEARCSGIVAPFSLSLESSLMLSAVVVAGAVVVTVVGGFELEKLSEFRRPDGDTIGTSVTDGDRGDLALGFRMIAWFGRDALVPGWFEPEMPVLSVDAADLFLGGMEASLRRVELFWGCWRCIMSVMIEEAVLS